MYYTLVALLWLPAAVFGATALRSLRRQRRQANEQPLLTLRDSPGVFVLLVRLLVAGGCFGFGLAMLFDRWFGAWGVLLAAVVCVAVGGTACRRWEASQQEERA